MVSPSHRIRRSTIPNFPGATRHGGEREIGGTLLTASHDVNPSAITTPARIRIPPRRTSGTGSREVARRTRAMRASIGRQITELREEAAICVAELARCAGIDRAHLWRIEAATANASLEALSAIAACLGADVGVRLFPVAGRRLHDRFQAPSTFSGDQARRLSGLSSPGCQATSCPGSCCFVRQPRRAMSPVITSRRSSRPTPRDLWMPLPPSVAQPPSGRAPRSSGRGSNADGPSFSTVRPVVSASGVEDMSSVRQAIEATGGVGHACRTGSLSTGGELRDPGRGWPRRDSGRPSGPLSMPETIPKASNATMVQA